MRGWHAAARVVGMKGLEGKLRLADASAFLRSAHAGAQAAFVPPREDAPRFAVVDGFEECAPSGCVASFAGIEGPGAAERLVGCTVLLQGEEPVEDGSKEAIEGLVGFIVADVQLGEVGEVSAVDAGPDRVQPLITVARTDAPAVLIPLVDELIVSIDEADGRLLMQLPAGLLDL